MEKYKTVYIDGEMESQAWCTFCSQEVPEVVKIQDKSFICKKCTQEIMNEFDPNPTGTDIKIAKGCDWCGGERLGMSCLADHELKRMMPDPCPECGWLWGWDGK